MSIEIIFAEIKANLRNWSKETLIREATKARLKKSEENERMLYALIMDVLEERLPAEEFNELIETFDKF